MDGVFNSFSKTKTERPMANARSRKAVIRQLNNLKKEVAGLENQIIQTDLILHEYNKRIVYHDKFKEQRFRKLTKEKLRREVDQYNQVKFQLIERLLEKRQALEAIRLGDQSLV